MAQKKEPTPARGRGRPRSAEADSAIMSAALALFAECGFEGVSLEQVALRAGVSRTTLYRRWSSKEELLVDAIGRVRQGKGGPVDDYGTMDAKSFIKTMLDVVPQTLADPALARLTSRLFGSACSQPRLVRAYWQGYLEPRRRQFARAIAAMKANGVLSKDVDPDAFQDMLSGALCYRLLLQEPDNSVRAWRDYCRKLLRTAGFKVSGR